MRQFFFFEKGERTLKSKPRARQVKLEIILNKLQQVKCQEIPPSQTTTQLQSLQPYSLPSNPADTPDPPPSH